MLSTTTNPSVSTSVEKATTQLGNFLEEYSEIATILPVLVGLFVTSRLRLRGVQSLIVNLAIAAVARQLFSQLKKQAHPVVSEQPREQSHTEPSYTQAQSSPTGQVNAVSANRAEDYMIVHSVPGRIRLRIPRLMSDAIYAKRLEKLLQAEDKVLGTRMNRSASSLAIQYDGAGFTELELGLRLLQILDQAEQMPTNSAAN